jgi:hypothetical protein
MVLDSRAKKKPAKQARYNDKFALNVFTLSVRQTYNVTKTADEEGYKVIGNSLL